MDSYPSFLEHLRVRFGRNWCVAARVSGKTARYDVVITPDERACDNEILDEAIGFPYHSKHYGAPRLDWNAP